MGYHKHHHKHQKDGLSQKPQGSLCGIYRRLFKRYAFRHWGYLSVGIFFALIEGGALVTLCQLVGMVCSSFEGGKEAVQSQAIVAQAELPVEQVEVDAVESSQVESPAPVSHLPAEIQKQRSKAEKQTAKIANYVEKANAVLRKIGLPEVDKGDGVHLSGGMVIVLLIGLVVFFVLQALAILGNRFCLKWVGARVVADMRADLYGHLLDQSQAFYARKDMGVGMLISQCTNDINAVEVIISTSFPELIVSPVNIVASLCFLIYAVMEAHLPWSFALVIVVMVPAFFGVYWICRLLKRYQHRVLDSIARVTDRMQETYSGMAVIRAFHQEEREKNAFGKVNEKYFKSQIKAICAEVSVHPILQIVAMSMAGVFVWMCYENGLTLGVLGGMAFAAQSMYKPAKDLVKVNAGLQKGAAAAERFFGIMDQDFALPVPENPTRIDSFKDKVSFQDVSFRYTEDGADVLKNLNLDIKKGEMVALVGQTGSGKSTIASLLARFYDPSQGVVTMDGHNLKELDVEDFRQLVGVVSQDTFLFNTTIEENIRYGRPDATHEEVVEAARQANALEFIEADKDGFQRIVGERGNLLSGGQKQRIAIARAILRNPPILILDEATSALDTVTEKLVQDALNNVMKERTVLAIAHRLSTVRSASCILVLDEGKVLEQGTHDELMQKGGEYFRLANLQFQENSK